MTTSQRTNNGQSSAVNLQYPKAIADKPTAQLLNINP
jgi:hypothetical protein